MVRIVQKKTPNYRRGRAGQRPIAIVIHVMDGTLSGTDAWFANRESGVSAHYGIGKKGDVHQYVREEDTAYHAGTVDHPSWPLIKRLAINSSKYLNPNFYTIGIEHEGKAGEPFTEAMLAASAELIAAIAGRWQIPIDDEHIIPHHAIRSTKSCPGSGVSLWQLIARAKEKSSPRNDAA